MCIRDRWFTGPITLKSNINLHLNKGAVILFSPDIDLYPLIDASFEGLNLSLIHIWWKGNEVKYIFLITCVPLLIIFGISAFAIIIAWYVILSVPLRPFL